MPPKLPKLILSLLELGTRTIPNPCGGRGAAALPTLHLHLFPSPLHLYTDKTFSHLHCSPSPLTFTSNFPNFPNLPNLLNLPNQFRVARGGGRFSVGTKCRFVSGVAERLDRVNRRQPRGETIVSSRRGCRRYNRATRDFSAHRFSWSRRSRNAHCTFE